MAIGSNNPFPSVLVVEGTVPASPATGQQRVYIDTADHKFKRVTSSGTVVNIEAGGAIGTTAVLLDYIPAVDLQSGTAMTADAWVDVCANQTFTVGAVTSNIEAAVSGVVRVTSGVASGYSAQIVIDSAGTPVTKRAGGAGGVIDASVLQGTNLINLGSLTAGAHTIKLQARSHVAGTLYCRPASQAEEFLAVRVFERK